MELKKVYIVHPEKCHCSYSIDVDGVFSTREKAEAYMRRYPEMPHELFIQELVVDPEYLSFPDKSPYIVRFRENGEVRSVEKVNVPEFEIRALNEDVYEFLKMTDIYVFAKNEEQAIQRGLEIKKEMMENGVWAESDD
ncbi:DUF7336 domain-containing protein [Flavitalea flava]